jgi:squalene-associated FAD-dependent desaturase
MSAPAGIRVAVIGAGWAGLAAAVDCCAAGDRVTLFEMAPQGGGRARTVVIAGQALDNGQHILIGAYRDTLDLMRRVGVDPGQVLLRTRLDIRGPDGSGLAMPPGPPAIAFARGVWANRRWTRPERLSLLAHAGRWALAGFRCDPGWTVSRLCANLAPAVRRELIDPLCVAALNTPAEVASASMLLRVLADALFGGRGSADLLLPRVPLSGLLPDAALAWLAATGAEIRLSSRVMALAPEKAGWRVGDQPFDAVILACPHREAARLVQTVDPGWSAIADALAYQAIITVWLRSNGDKLPVPMMSLRDSESAPAQFAFDLGALGVADGLVSFVVSGAAAWVERGLDATIVAVRRQAVDALPHHFRAFQTGPAQPGSCVHAAAERRATFACVPGLRRPPASIAPGLIAAGDHVAGPYPATLEGAVRSGRSAAAALAVMRQTSRQDRAA